MTTTNQSQDQLEALKARLEAKEARLSQKLEEIQHDLECVTRTLSLLDRGEEKEAEDEAFPIRELRGCTQLDAIIRIASRYNNRVKIIQAKKLLFEAGMLNGNPKNFYNMLNTIIKRSGKFEHVGPGEFEFIGDADQPVMMPRKSIAS